MPPLTLRYARTTDSVLLAYAPTHADRPGRRWRDVIAVDASGREIARWPWYYSTKPRQGRKTVTLDCARYEARWEHA